MRIGRYVIAGFAAGAVTGILSSGGGLILVPLLTVLCKEDKDIIFPCSLGIMLPICTCSLLLQCRFASTPFQDASLCLLGGAIGGIVSATIAKRIPMTWLHRLFGCVVLWSGVKCLLS